MTYALQRLLSLNLWSPVGGAVWGSLGDTAVPEKVHPCLPFRSLTYEVQHNLVLS